MPVNKYKTKKGYKYEYRVYVERFGKAVQVHKRGFATKQEATAAAAELVISKKTSYSSNVTFKQLYEEYIRAYRLNHKPQSIRKTISLYENQALPFFKNAIISKISINDYLEWKERILTKNYSDSYNKGLHTAMVTILKYAQKNYSLKRNVAQDAGGFIKRGIKKKHEVWNIEQYKSFLNTIDSVVDKAFYIFLFETGCRFGEAAALTWNDYYGTYVEIVKTIAKETDNNNYIINSPKRDSSIRKVNLSKVTIHYIEQLKEMYSNCIGFSNDWYIFGGINRLSHTTMTRHKNEYCVKANIPQIEIHSFRRSHASVLLEAGIPITNIADRLGHSTPQTTIQNYLKIVKKANDPIVDILDKLDS